LIPSSLGRGGRPFGNGYPHNRRARKRRTDIEIVKGQVVITRGSGGNNAHLYGLARIIIQWIGKLLPAADAIVFNRFYIGIGSSEVSRNGDGKITRPSGRHPAVGCR